MQATLSRRAPADTAPPLDQPAIVVLSANGEEVTHPLPRDGRERLVGRSRFCQIALQDETASARHFALRATSDSAFVCDVRSRHGTYLNGRKLAIEEQTPLCDGDEIRAGATRFIYQCHADRLRAVFAARDDAPPTSAESATVEATDDCEVATANRGIEPAVSPSPAAADAPGEPTPTEPTPEPTKLGDAGARYTAWIWPAVLVIGSIALACYLAYVCSLSEFGNTVLLEAGA